MFQNEDGIIAQRRLWVFMILAGIFLGSLTMLNILGTSRFITFDVFSLFGLEIPFSVAVGVLPYPITFLCTDLISELYGKRKASMLVWIGLILNVWVLLVLWMGGALSAPDLNEGLPEVTDNTVPYDYAFYFIRKLTFGAVLASMVAYLVAQFVDVHVFHWLKEKTKGKKLWLRNNVSTLTSQLVDSIAVILITHKATDGLPLIEGYEIGTTLFIYILSSYSFKVVVALIDTIPFYFLTKYLTVYLGLDGEPEEDIKPSLPNK